MKRIVIILVALSIALGGHAQTDTQPDTSRSCQGCRQVEFNIDLGLSAGATMFNNGNDDSPYYSKYGFFLQLPLMAHWQFTPHWKFSTGLRYDFNWNPLYYAIEPVGEGFDGYEQGLRFLQTPVTSNQKGHAFNSYVGIPLELKWYPSAQHKSALGIAFDLFAGYAVTQYFAIDYKNPPVSDHADCDFDYDKSNFKAMVPWKLEVGLSLISDRPGLLHGLRFFGNLLPTYKDPLSGKKVYTFGMSFFL